MPVWVLMVVFTLGDAPALHWFVSPETCLEAAPAQVLHYELTNRPVAYSRCVRVRHRVLPPITGELDDGR
jgi:hypothetical protein